MYTGGLASEENSRFLEELISKVSPAYAIFRNGGLGAGSLVDLIVSEKLRVPEAFAERGAMDEAALTAWSKAAAGGKPYRDAIQVILDHFPGWWQNAGESGRAALAQYLPQIAPAAADLGDTGIRDLIAIGEAALATAATYSLADTAAVKAIAAIARAGRADSGRCSTLLPKLVDAFPLKMIEDSRDAERFLPALGRAIEASGEGWAEALELAITLVANDPSSAYGTLEAIPKALAKAQDKQAYLAAFASLAKAMGNRVAGLCLKKLPGAGRAQIDTTLDLADRYGVLAAERYLESAA